MRFALVLVVVSGCAIIVPEPAKEANGRCAAFIADGQLDQADAACDVALEYQPRYWDALHNKGLIAQQRGDRAKAKEFYIKAVRAFEHMRVTHNSLGAMEMEDGNFDAAASHFKKALEIEPTYLEARRNLGAVLLKKQAWSDAVSEFRKLTLIEPRLVEGHVGLAVSLMPLGKLDEAKASLDRATDLDVAAEDAWLLKGQLEQSRGQTGEAMECFERCLLANEKNLACQRALESLTSR